ncbi:MAG: hypothetical protein HY306_10085 [Nitrosomonadales bacterium]|nr:hypothetical protein [Nitrosomonadales bacterium]
MRVIKADQPSVVWPMQGKGVVQSVRFSLTFLYFRYLEFQPVAASITVDVSIECQQEFKRI